MHNPFNQPNFQITEDYINRCIKAATVPCTTYMITTHREFPGELDVIIAEKDKFIDAEHAMMSLMQRMVVLLSSDSDELEDYNAENIANLTLGSCMSKWYNEHEYTKEEPGYFEDEAEFYFGAFTGYYNENVSIDKEVYGFFKNRKPVEGFEKINPLADEVISEAYSLVKVHDGCFIFAISEKNYIIFNWMSGGPMHLWIKPSRRIPGSMLVSQNAFYDALGIKKEPE